MPKTLPASENSTKPPAIPLPLCMGPLTELWVETIKTHEDVQSFWRGYALGGAFCVVLLVVELVVIVVLL